MKRFFIVAILISSLLFAVACGDKDTKDKGDTGNTGNTGDTGDTGDTGNTGDTGDTGDTAVECVGISIASLEKVEGMDSYEGTLSKQIGDDTLEDVISFQFYTEDYSPVPELPVGTYDLGTGVNANYNACSECVLIFEDENTKTYFQESGTITITENKAGTIETKGTLTAKLVEVTIAEDYTSTPVEGGGCYEIEGEWDTVCVPECDGKVCGDDGCGGECGEGCGIDEACKEDQTGCVAYECETVTLSTFALGTVSVENNYAQYDAEYDPNTGNDTVADEMILEFYALPTAMSYDLKNTNYADCEQCILVFEDIEYDAETGDATAIGKYYFQQKGTISVESFSNDGKIKGKMENVRLVQVTIDSSYTSTQIGRASCRERV